jgi:hypothetical protein
MNGQKFHLLDPLFHRVMFVVRAYEKRRSTAAPRDASDEGVLVIVGHVLKCGSPRRLLPLYETYHETDF